MYTHIKVFIDIINPVNKISTAQQTTSVQTQQHHGASKKAVVPIIAMQQVTATMISFRVYQMFSFVVVGSLPIELIIGDSLNPSKRIV